MMVESRVSKVISNMHLKAQNVVFLFFFELNVPAGGPLRYTFISSR